MITNFPTLISKWIMVYWKNQRSFWGFEYITRYKVRVPVNDHHIPSRRFRIHWNGEVFKGHNCYVFRGYIGSCPIFCVQNFGAHMGWFREVRCRKVDLFYSIIAKLIWLSHRAGPNMLKDISHLYTRVTALDVDDWRKLNRLLQFVNCTISDEVFVDTDSLHEMVIWIDDTHDIHQNMWGLTGGCIYFCTRVEHTISKNRNPIQEVHANLSWWVSVNTYICQSGYSCKLEQWDTSLRKLQFMKIIQAQYF